MNILVAAAECAPFAKTGGLADVVGTIPKVLRRLGHQAAVIMPLYRRVRTAGYRVEADGPRLDVPIGRGVVAGRVCRGRLPDSDVPVYFIDQPTYYDREELYQQNGHDFPDNCERFVFFSRAVLEAVRALDLAVDVIHTNDWQTGLVSVYLDQLFRGDPRLGRVGTLFTIHNIAYQGHFWHWDMELTGLDWRLFNWRQLEFYGHLNLLKAGLVFADVLNTVSPSYAEQIKTAEYGHGMEGVLQWRSADLFGILNGIDDTVWNPATDRNIATRYTVEAYPVGKRACKRDLERICQLPRTDGPLIGMVTRLDDQKGLDLVAEALPAFLTRDIQVVVLGTGDPKYHQLFDRWNREYRGKFVAKLTFDDRLAHQIEAGADIFLMPSRFEPCGLNQLYSLKYGTVPVVRATGGLADTIVDATPENLAAGRANGFSFVEYDAGALAVALERALEAYGNPAVWDQLVRTGMQQDWSWDRSVADYVKLYERAVRKHASRP